MAEKLFFGNTTLTGNTGQAANYQIMETFTSAYTGVITTLELYNRIGGAVKCVLYSGAKNNADLEYSDLTGTVGGVGWQSFNCTVNATTGQTFQLGGISDVGTLAQRAVAGERYYTPTAYAGFTPPDPMDASGWIYSPTTQNLFAAYGWENPTVSSVTSLIAGLTSTITGTDFMSSQGTGKVELCTTSDYSGTKYDVTETSWSDTSVEFTVPQLCGGTYYVFVTTDLGLRNQTGYQVLLTSVYTDYALGALAAPTGITWDNGLTFDTGTSVVTVPDEPALRMPAAVTIFAAGGLADGYLVEKGSNYSLSAAVSGSDLTLTANGVAAASAAASSVQSVAVTLSAGNVPRFFADGEYYASGATPITLPTGTDDLLIGNTSGGGSEFEGTLWRVRIFNRVLTDAEIRLMHYGAVLGDSET